MIEALAESIGLNFIQPNGALYIFVQLPDCYDSVKLANKLLDCGLAISPGTMFGNYKNFIRLSVCQDTKQLIEGMDILNNILNGES
jgi:aspartate aminotransferase